MKITQETNEFKPITIVLETREEEDQMIEIMGDVSGLRYPISAKIYDFLTEKIK